MMNLFKGGIYMDKELYKKLREIENNLFWLAKNNDMIYDDKLGDIWFELDLYLTENKPDDL